RQARPEPWSHRAGDHGFGEHDVRAPQQQLVAEARVVRLGQEVGLQRRAPAEHGYRSLSVRNLQVEIATGRLAEAVQSGNPGRAERGRPRSSGGLGLQAHDDATFEAALSSASTMAAVASLCPNTTPSNPRVASATSLYAGGRRRLTTVRHSPAVTVRASRISP